MPTLTVGRTHTSGPGRTLQFGRKTVLVGRSPNCTICLKDPTVSRLHFAISWRPNTGWVLTRHKSAQPVWVNDQAVETRPLRGGEAIRIGDFTLAFTTDDRPAAQDDTIRNHPAVAPSGEHPSAYLVVESAVPAAQPIPLARDLVVIGRGDACDVVLDDHHCSRNHAEIHRVGDGFVLRDLGSTNGVFLNDTRVVADVALRSDDLIRMGQSRIRFLTRGVSARPPSPQPGTAASASASTQPLLAPPPPRPTHAGLRAVGVSALAGFAVLGLVAILAMPGRRLSIGLSRASDSLAGRSTPDHTAPEKAVDVGAIGPDEGPRIQRAALATASPARSVRDSVIQPPPPNTPALSAVGGGVIPEGHGHESGSGNDAAGPLAAVEAAVVEAAALENKALALPGPAAPEPPVAAVHAAPVEPPAQRLAVPDVDEVNAATKDVIDAYGDELSPNENVGEVIARLVDSAHGTTRPTSKYALLLLAEQVAVQAGAYRDAITVLDMRSELFDEDSLEKRLAMLSNAVNAANGGDREVFDLTMQAARDAIRAERFDVAAKAAALARSVAIRIESGMTSPRPGGLPPGARHDETAASTAPGTRGTPEPSLVMSAQRLRNRITECRVWQRKYLAAVETQSESPGDPRACDVVGKYLCFVKEDWHDGLATLAIGRDEHLRELARQELELPTRESAVPETFALANAWWDLAEATSRSKDLPSWHQESVRQHAASIYATVVDQLTDPVDNKLARRRMAECGLSPAADGPAIGNVGT